MGSPPPTRGTPGWQVAHRHSQGITPAYAGNTRQAILYHCNGWDHPRLRGEHSANSAFGFIVSGSPPPTRGTLFILVTSAGISGITPAYAGNTRLQKKRSFIYRDHPRLRGEHNILTFLLSLPGGSPPPTRGTHL